MSNTAALDTKDIKEQEAFEQHHNENGISVAEDGGIVDRARMEKRLLWKLDARFSMYVLLPLFSTLLAGKGDFGGGGSFFANSPVFSPETIR